VFCVVNGRVRRMLRRAHGQTRGISLDFVGGDGFLGISVTVEEQDGIKKAGWWCC
jgi:hypothetical protein